MGRTPREDLQIEKRRQQVAELYLQGWTQSAIACELAVSQPTISADLKAVRREWRDSRIRDFDEAVGTELKKIERIEREAWAAWARSQQPSESTRIVQGDGSKHVEKSVHQQVGNPRFLEQIHKTSAARRALLGLDAPVRIAPTSPDGTGTYHAQVMQELLQLAEQAAPGPKVIDANFINRLVEQELAARASESLPPDRGLNRGAV